MGEGDLLFRLKVKVSDTGGEAEAEVVALTPQTVLLKIDPHSAWDRDALRHLSAALEVLAKTLPLRASEPRE
jgi:hypothetical protein